MNNKKNVLVGCTGSIAAIKLPVVLNLLKKRDPTFHVSNLCVFVSNCIFFLSHTLSLSLSLAHFETRTYTQIFSI